MKKNKIKSLTITIIDIRRDKLITKEEMEKYCKGENDYRKNSVNDDLELLFEDLRLEKESKYANTYFLPKLTKKELKLVERKDKIYLQTFHWAKPDVKEAEMMLSESDSKFVEGIGRRDTYTIENSSE